MQEQAILSKLERRLGRFHARQRLGIERDHEAQIFGQGLNFFHIENWYTAPTIISTALWLLGLYQRGRSNAADVQVRHNDFSLKRLPKSFDGFTLLHISDLHVDMSEAAMLRLADLLPTLDYDICVLTGDYRGATYGPIEPSLAGMARICAHLKGPVYGVLGNHDSIRMVPELEEMGIRMLLNKSATILRGDDKIHLAGIDDAHFYRVDNLEKAAADIPEESFSILLSHTPEIYRHAAHCDFDLLLAGHTHGGQICLPGAIPITLDSVLPRRMGAGSWAFHTMQAYTSVGAGSSIIAARLNCPPEIALHHLRCA